MQLHGDAPSFLPVRLAVLGRAEAVRTFYKLDPSTTLEEKAVALFKTERVDEAIEQVLGEDIEVEVQEGVWAPLAAPLGLEPRAAREACSVLNGLPIQERLAFFRIVIEREDTGRAARELEVEEDELLRSARSALEQLIRWLETSAREEG